MMLHNLAPKELEELIKKAVKEEFVEFKKTLSVENPNELLTRAEACEFLKIDSSTLWHWTNKGKITAYGIAYRRYYKKQELLESLVKLNK